MSDHRGVAITPRNDDQLVTIPKEIDHVGGADLKAYVDVYVAASGVLDEVLPALRIAAGCRTGYTDGHSLRQRLEMQP